MEIRFVAKKPWINADMKLKKALMITTALMAIIGLICAIVGVILTVYQEYVVGIVSIIIGALIPVSYFLVNVFMLAEQRKKFDRNLIVEYTFFEDRMEVVSLSNNYKSKSVVNYSGLISLKTRIRYFFLRFETESFVIRKGDIKAESDKARTINELLVYLNSKIRDNMLAKESTCATDEVLKDDIEEVKETNDNVYETDFDIEEIPADMAMTENFENQNEGDEIIEVDEGEYVGEDPIGEETESADNAEEPSDAWKADESKEVEEDEPLDIIEDGGETEDFDNIAAESDTESFEKEGNISIDGMEAEINEACSEENDSEELDEENDSENF